MHASYTHVVVAQHESGDLSFIKCANQHVARIFKKEFTESDPGLGSAVTLETAANVIGMLRPEESEKFHKMPAVNSRTKQEAAAFAKAVKYCTQIRNTYTAKSYSYGGLEREWNETHDRLCAILFGVWPTATAA